MMMVTVVTVMAVLRIRRRSRTSQNRNAQQGKHPNLEFHSHSPLPAAPTSNYRRDDRY